LATLSLKIINMADSGGDQSDGGNLDAEYSSGLTIKKGEVCYILAVAFQDNYFQEYGNPFRENRRGGMERAYFKAKCEDVKKSGKGKHLRKEGGVDTIDEVPNFVLYDHAIPMTIAPQKKDKQRLKSEALAMDAKNGMRLDEGDGKLQSKDDTSDDESGNPRRELDDDKHSSDSKSHGNDSKTSASAK
jgi:hypothetical protein